MTMVREELGAIRQRLLEIVDAVEVLDRRLEAERDDRLVVERPVAGRVVAQAFAPGGGEWRSLSTVAVPSGPYALEVEVEPGLWPEHAVVKPNGDLVRKNQHTLLQVTGPSGWSSLLAYVWVRPDSPNTCLVGVRTSPLVVSSTRQMPRGRLRIRYEAEPVGGRVVVAVRVNGEVVATTWTTPERVPLHLQRGADPPHVDPGVRSVGWAWSAVTLTEGA
jgi:hypothetical protein